MDAKTGEMKTQWIWVDSKWYYLDSVNGDMKTVFHILPRSISILQSSVCTWFPYIFRSARNNIITIRIIWRRRSWIRTSFIWIRTAWSITAGKRWIISGTIWIHSQVIWLQNGRKWIINGIPIFCCRCNCRCSCSHSSHYTIIHSRYTGFITMPFHLLIGRICWIYRGCQSFFSDSGNRIYKS